MGGNCSFPQKMRMKWIGLEKVCAIQSAISDRSYSYFILYLTLKELDTLQIQGCIHLHPTLRAGCVYHLSRTTMGVFKAGLKPNGPSGVTENNIRTESPKAGPEWVLSRSGETKSYLYNSIFSRSL
jgi:hypothetical protein